MTYPELLARLRVVIEEVSARDREERRKRVRSAFGLKPDGIVPDALLAAGRIPSYQITVDTEGHRALQCRAACAVVLAEYLGPDVATMIREL